MRAVLDKPTLYDSDFFLWTQDQARLLREDAARRVNTHLDLENLAEEVESLGERDRREVVSRLTRILEHLLKLQHSPAEQPRRGWARTVRLQRQELSEILSGSPSLRLKAEERFTRAWRHALIEANDGLEQDGITLPPDLEPTISLEQALDEGWWPTEPTPDEAP